MDQEIILFGVFWVLDMIAFNKSAKNISLPIFRARGCLREFFLTDMVEKNYCALPRVSM